MVRIKTIQKSGATFLSPFVFTQEQAEKKINSIKKWLKRTAFEIVPVDKFNPLSVWKEIHPIFDHTVFDSVEMLKGLEATWDKIK